jgi:subtilisin family serine protease
MHTLVTPHATDRRRWKVLILTGVLALTLFSPSLPYLAPQGNGPTQPRLVMALAAAGNATPDCGTPPADPFPALQRVKHLARLGVDRWHAAGYRGKGIKIAVLDSGFRGYRDFLGKVLPRKVLVRSFRRDGNLEAKDSQHGILCGEVIHALAPEAELLFANWEPDRSDQFLEAVRWARQQEACLISCSLIMPSWSDGEGNGRVHEALAGILGTGTKPDDLLYFACAGNIAQRHWSGTFYDAGDGFHEWQPGSKVNRLSPWGSERVSVEMCWRPGPDYELIVCDAGTAEEVGRSAARSGGERGCAVVNFTPREQHRYEVRVRLARGKGGAFHLVALGGGLDQATARGSVCFPGDGHEVIAVGAVGSDDARAAYSSCGPNSRQPKPDLVATVPFPSLWRDRPFSGTSAAAPQAAALAALWWSRHPNWTANQVREALRNSAQDLGPSGHDSETGYGLIRLPALPSASSAK